MSRRRVSFSANLMALAEKETLRLLINYGFEKISEELHVCDYLLLEINDLKFETPIYQTILQAYKKALEQGILPNAEYLLASEDSLLKKEIIDMVTQEHEISPNWEKKHQIFTNKEADDLSKTVYNTVLRLKRKVVKKLLDEAMLKMKAAKEEEIPSLQAVYMELKNYQVDIDRQLGTVISY